MQLNQVTLEVDNIDQARAFYLTLGATLIVDTPHYLRFSPDAGASFSLVKADKVRAHGAVIYFECQHLDQQVEALQAKGLTFEQRPTDQPYLWREAILYDPSGNKIKLYWAGENRLNPPWRVK